MSTKISLWAGLIVVSTAMITLVPPPISIAKSSVGTPNPAWITAGSIGQTNQQDSDRYVMSGIQKDNNQDYKRELADYNRAIQLNPRNANNYYMRGCLKEKLNDIQGALADFNRSIQLPNDYAAAVYFNRGSLKYHKLKDRAGAINDMKQAAKLYQQEGIDLYYREAIDLVKEWQQTNGN